MENKLKNFSTIAFIIALCSSLLSPFSPAFAAKKCAFLANAPDQHVVVKGDTLWGISQKFLEHPWCWPQVWGMNRDEIKNPHWIYPGQVVYFDRKAGRLRLGKPMGDSNLPNVRLSPHIRNQTGYAISSIPASAIEPFLSQPVVFEDNQLSFAPRVVSVSRDHVNGAFSEKAYVMGNIGDQTDFNLYRPSNPLVDPVTNEFLGYEHAYVGSVKLLKLGATPDEAHTFLITKTNQEVSLGDRLMVVPAAETLNYVPHPPADMVDGRIVSVYGGVAQAGQNQTVAINLGARNGIEMGTVLQLYRTGNTIVDKTTDKSVLVRLPDEEYGTLFIYRVFNKVAYGLIMQVSDSTNIGDTVRSPE